MNWFKRWWQKTEPDATVEPQPLHVVESPCPGISTEIADGIYQSGWRHGFASGELSGRQRLLQEIQVDLAARGKLPDDFDVVDLKAHITRQVH